MDFSDVIGQESAKQELIQLANENRIPHAMLFTGPEGCGKFALALAFASYLLTNVDDEMKRKSAEAMLRSFEHPDLHFSFPTIKPKESPNDYKPVSDDFINEWKELMKEGPYPTSEQWQNMIGEGNKNFIITAKESDTILQKLSLMSSQGGYKISIIWLPEKMHPACANKLLKLLEEPPHMTVFILVSEEPELLLETIKSRTQRFDFKKIDTPSMTEALIKRRSLEEETAHQIARVANGNWNKALEELNVGNENRQFLDLFITLMRLAYMRNIHDLKKWSENIYTFTREKQKRMLKYFLRMIRENFMYNFQNPELIYMTREEENFSKNFARYINEANVVDIYILLDRCYRDIGQNANAKILFFDLALNIIVLLIRK